MSLPGKIENVQPSISLIVWKFYWSAKSKLEPLMNTLLLVSHMGRRRVGKLSQEHPTPHPHPESVGICYLGKEVMDFFSLSLKAASVFSIGEGRPSCSHSSFLTGSAVYDLAQNSRKHPKILMHGDIKQHSHKPAAPHFHRDPGIHKGEGQARAWVLRTRVPSLHVCLSIIAMQV